MNRQKYLNSIPLSILLFVFMFLLTAVVYMTKTMFSSALAVIVEEGVMTKSQTGLLTAVFWLVYAPFQVVGGFAVDRIPPFRLIMIGLFGAMAANTVIYLNQSYPVMMAAWAFNAMIQFGVWPGVFKIVSTQLIPKLRETAVFWLLFSTSLGLGISMLIASFVKRWQNNFLVSAVSLLIMLLAYAVLNHVLSKRMVDEQFTQPDAPQKNVEKAPMLPLLMSSGLWVFLITNLFRVAIDNGIKMMTPVMLMESYSTLPAALSTRISTVLIVFSACGTLIAGFVKIKITRNESKALILFYSVSLLPLLAVYFIGRIQYIWILLALSSAIMMISGASPFNQAFVSLHFAKHGRIGTVSGITNATASMGNVLASYIFAKMAEIMSWQSVALCWLAVILGCSLMCVAVLRRWTKFITKE